MAKTVAEILRETGWSDEEIKGLDAAKLDGLTKVVSSANESLEKAELVSRAQREEYDQRIAPALANWADQDTRLSTENAAMKTYLSKIKDSGYLPKEVLEAMPGVSGPSNPNPNPGVRDGNGRFVAGANAVPGSPGFVDVTTVQKKLEGDIAGAFSFAADTQWNYRRLHGKEMPDSPTTLIREAAANRMSPSEWAAKKYDFSAREATIKAEEQKKHDDAIRKEVADSKDKEYAEKFGNNPNVRIPSESAFANVNKAVAEGKRQDPLKMSPEQRKANTHSNIQKDLSERSSMVQ